MTMPPPRLRPHPQFLPSFGKGARGNTDGKGEWRELGKGKGQPVLLFRMGAGECGTPPMTGDVGRLTEAGKWGTMEKGHKCLGRGHGCMKQGVQAMGGAMEGKGKRGAN